MSRWIFYFQLSGIELDILQGVPLSLSIWSHPASLSSSGLSSNASFRSKPFLLRVVSEPNAATETNGVCSVQIDEETPEKSSDKTVTKDGRSAKGLITDSVTAIDGDKPVYHDLLLSSWYYRLLLSIVMRRYCSYREEIHLLWIRTFKFTLDDWKSH